MRKADPAIHEVRFFKEMPRNIGRLSLFIIILTLLSPVLSYSQPGKLPPFRMTQKDGKIFMAQNLPFDKPILIIYFSPDCEECQKLTSDILKHNDEFSGVSIAMVTYLPVEYLAPFIAKFNLGNYPNIYVGTEGSSFFLRYYYNVSGFPFMALYDKNGNLIKTWSQVHDITDLRKQVRNL